MVLIAAYNFLYSQDETAWRSANSFVQATYHFSSYSALEFASNFAFADNLAFFGGGISEMGSSSNVEWTGSVKAQFVFKFNTNIGFVENCFMIDTTFAVTTNVNWSAIEVDDVTSTYRTGID